ncbi:Asp-tRNA(Asn)/Glu-tRNA(Gln) amidotransferase subunit GatA [Patescibacteria group bacterium]|nr:Asp-tRNA(Asn)/Glu-tRNA(Gln) amidotransferase subunit GatA [Patescibacteria group bacterium]
MKLSELSLKEASQKIQAREISSLELTHEYLNNIEKVEPKVSAYLEVTSDLAIKGAKAADKKIKEGNYNSPLLGIPAALKDNMLALGTRSTAASRILQEYQSAYDSTVAARLSSEGMVLLGKTNLDEFAMGSSTENSAFQKTKNPWNLKKVPGGSSGGSAAAVAAGECVYALGSDTGGSIRQPAAFCGVVGLKPTYGRVSRYGLIALASSLDQIGPLTKTVEDSALILNVIAGQDQNDSTTAPVPVEDYTKNLSKSIKSLKIGIPKEYFVGGINKDVEKTVRQSIAQLEDLGASIKEVSLPFTDYALAVYYIILPAEASANLSRYDGIRYGYSIVMDDKKIKDLFSVYSESRAKGFGDEVKRRIMIGTYSLSSGFYDAYYRRAQKVRELVKNDFAEVFTDVDVLATPTTPTTAFGLDEMMDDPLTMYLSDIFTVSANISGIPAISVPCGFSDGLPVGLQFMAKPYAESLLLQVAHQFEQNNSWYKEKAVI